MGGRKRQVIALVVIFVLLILCVFICQKCTNKDESAQSKNANVEAEEKNMANNQKLNKEETATQDASEPADVKDTVAENKETQTVTSNSQETKSSSAEQHTHNWVKSTTTVHHDATGHYENVCVKEAWTETVPVYEEVAIEVCGNCGADCSANPGAHIEEHMLNGTGKYGCHTEYVQKQTGTQTISHPAEYKKQWVVDKEAWDETVVTYKCSCGATK